MTERSEESGCTPVNLQNRALISRAPDTAGVAGADEHSTGWLDVVPTKVVDRRRAEPTC
jgi:hypothetical protein